MGMRSILLVIRWILVGCYVVIIFVFGQSPESSSTRMSDNFLHWFPFLDNFDIGTIIFWVRKSIHVFGYGFATILIYAAAVITPVIKKYTYGVAFGLSLLLAVCDEWYQTTLPHRDGSIKDVGIDLIGIVLALGATRLLWFRRVSVEQKSQKENSRT